MAIQWTDAVLNAQAEGSWTPPDEMRVHSADPGTDGTAGEISGSAVAVSWTAAGDEGPLGASSQPATPGYAYAAPSTTLVEDGSWLSFWLGSTFQGRAQCPSTAVAGTYQPNLALVA